MRRFCNSLPKKSHRFPLPLVAARFMLNLSRDQRKRSLCLWLFVFSAAVSAEPVDWIWTARYIIPMDAQRRVIENGAIAIRGERIVALGAQSEINHTYQPKQRLDRPEALIAPGLINTHTHAPMVLLRGIADDLRLQDWLEKYIFP